MKIRQIIESRRNPQVNNQRGMEQVFEYLKSLPPDVLNRSYVHLSDIEKIGISPMSQSTMVPFEPIGVYTYAAAKYLKRKGKVEYSAVRPYVSVITVKPNLRIATKVKVTSHYRNMKEKYGNLHGNKAHTLSNKILRSAGFDLAATANVDGEVAILNPSAIETYKTFVVNYIPRGHVADSDPEEMGNMYWLGPDRDRTPHYSLTQLKKLIDNEVVLNQKQEYDLLVLDPNTYTSYLSTLSKKNLTPKLSATDRAAAERKRQTRLSKIPPKEQTWDLGDRAVAAPSNMTAVNLLALAKKNRRPLTAEQEYQLLINDADRHFELKYSKFLSEIGATWSLSKSQKKAAIAKNRRMYYYDADALSMDLSDYYDEVEDDNEEDANVEDDGDDNKL